jgi:mono/diheme cytochrome c family protein
MASESHEHPLYLAALTISLGVVFTWACAPAAEEPLVSGSTGAELGPLEAELPEDDEELPAVVMTAAGPGNPAAGRDFLLNGDYMGCGVPKRLFDLGPDAEPFEKIASRTGDNTDVAYPFTVLDSQDVPTVTSNCMRCHYGAVRGEVVPGLGDTFGDYTVNELELLEKASKFLTDEAESAAVDHFLERYADAADHGRTRTIGTNPGNFSMAVMFAHRDPQTWEWSDEPLLEYPDVVAPSDVPPWWRVRKKDRLYATGSGVGDHVRFMMVASTGCVDDTDRLGAIAERLPDVLAYLYTLQPPEFPETIDEALVAEGEAVFEETCADCHGTYGESETFPNELVDIDDVGTDPTMLTEGFYGTERFREWFAASPFGKDAKLEVPRGYVAPPLDGIWATAPFLHNGSVPTLQALLDSESRPAYWQRSTNFEAYDLDQVGLQYEALEHGQDEVEDHAARSRIYDTTQPGYSNVGHTYGDILSARERRAVIEYLKTL